MLLSKEGCSYLMLSLICFFFLNLDYIVWFWENGFKWKFKKLLY